MSSACGLLCMFSEVGEQSLFLFEIWWVVKMAKGDGIKRRSTVLARSPVSVVRVS